MEENNIEKGDGACLVGSTAIFSPVEREGLRKKIIFEGRSEVVGRESHMDIGEVDSKSEKTANANILRQEAARYALVTAKLQVPLEPNWQWGERRKYSQSERKWG